MSKADLNNISQGKMSHRLTQNSYLCNAGLCPKIVGSHTLVHSIVLLCISTADAQHILVHLGNHKQCPLSSLHNKTLGFHLCVCLSVLCYKRKEKHLCEHTRQVAENTYTVLYGHTQRMAIHAYGCYTQTHTHMCAHTHTNTHPMHAYMQPHNHIISPSL